MNNPAPGFEKHPGYAVDIEVKDVRLRVLAGATVIADSTHPVAVTETKHHPVWYLPLDDVDASIITATATSTFCPFKGYASYWTISTAHGDLEDVMWSYREPFDECLELKDYVAFYTDRVDLEIDGKVGDRVGPGWTGQEKS